MGTQTPGYSSSHSVSGDGHISGAKRFKLQPQSLTEMVGVPCALIMTQVTATVCCACTSSWSIREPQLCNALRSAQLDGLCGAFKRGLEAEGEGARGSQRRRCGGRGVEAASVPPCLTTRSGSKSRPGRKTAREKPSPMTHASTRPAHHGSCTLGHTPPLPPPPLPALDEAPAQKALKKVCPLVTMEL